jgi:putative intracellular protease/amidase
MKVLIYVPQGFSDENLSMVELFLSKWGIRSDTTSYSGDVSGGAHGAVCHIDIRTGYAKLSDYDGIVLVDGTGIDSSRLFDYRPILDLIMALNNSGKIIIAINNAVKIVARANIITGKRISVKGDRSSSDIVRLFRGVPSAENVEIAGNILTMHDGKDGSIETPMKKAMEYIESKFLASSHA